MGEFPDGGQPGLTNAQPSQASLYFATGDKIERFLDILSRSHNRAFDSDSKQHLVELRYFQLLMGTPNQGNRSAPPDGQV